MRRWYVLMLLLLSLVVSGIIANATNQTNEVEILKIQPAKIDPIDLAKKLGVKGEIKRMAYGWRAMSDSELFIVRDIGTVIYLSKDAFGSYRRDRMPSNAKDIADKFLEEFNLRPKMKVKYKGTVDDEKIIYFRNGTKVKLIMNRHVNYELEYNGIRLIGPGAKVRVYLGDDGRVTGVITQLWTVKPVKKVKIKSPEEVARELGVNVDSIELVYYVPTFENNTNKAYIIPAYVIKAHTIIDGTPVRIGKIVPAVSIEEIKELMQDEET